MNDFSSSRWLQVPHSSVHSSNWRCECHMLVVIVTGRIALLWYRTNDGRFPEWWYRILGHRVNRRQQTPDCSRSSAARWSQIWPGPDALLYFISFSKAQRPLAVAAGLLLLAQNDWLDCNGVVVREPSQCFNTSLALHFWESFSTVSLCSYFDIHFFSMVVKFSALLVRGNLHSFCWHNHH